MDFRIRQLRCFLSLSETLNYRRTAETLYISQPAISFQIQTLEDALGVKLFERDKKGVRLTPEGSVMVGYAAAILRLTKESRDHLGNMRPQRRVKVSIDMNAMPCVMPKLLRSLASLNPPIEVDFESLSTKDQIEKLREGQIDLIAMTPELPTSDFQFVPIQEAPIRALVSHHHALAKRQTLWLRELEQETILVPALHECPFSQLRIRDLLSGRSVSAAFIEVAQEFSIQLAFVSAGIGIALTYASTGWQPFKDVVSIPICDPQAKVTLGYLVKKGPRREEVMLFESALALSVRDRKPKAQVEKVGKHLSSVNRCKVKGLNNPDAHGFAGLTPREVTSNLESV